VNPAVQSALIAAGVGLAGTVVVAVSGFRNFRRVSIETSLAAADTAHRDRLWARQAATYEAALTRLVSRQAQREDLLRLFRYSEEYEKRIAEMFDSQDEKPWFQAQAQILAYASPEVVDAMGPTTVADTKVRAQHDRWKRLYDQAQAGGTQAVTGAREDFESALEAAHSADGVLMNLIRADLHRRPSEALSSPAPPSEPWPGLMGPPDPA
jgi:hypothetical protein